MVFPIHERDYQFGGTITLAYKYILLILFNINTGEENGLNRALKKETPTLPKTVVKEIEDKTPDYDLGHDSMKEVEESKEEDFKKKYGIREPLSELPEVPETKVSVSTDKPNFAALFTEEKEVPTLPSIVETVEDIDDDIDEMPETVMDDPAPVIKANAANLEQKYQALENRIFEDPILESLPCHPKYIFEMQKGKRRTNKTYRELIIAFLTGGEPEFRAMLIQKYQLTPEDVINFATRVIAERELIPAVFKNTISEVDIDVPTKTPRDVTQYFKITEAINQLGISETQILDAIHLLQDTGKLEDKYRHEDKVHVPTFLINANKNDILLVLNETKR
jgi:hypothetical protein